MLASERECHRNSCNCSSPSSFVFSVRMDTFHCNYTEVDHLQCPLWPKRIPSSLHGPMGSCPSPCVSSTVEDVQVIATQKQPFDDTEATTVEIVPHSIDNEASQGRLGFRIGALPRTLCSVPGLECSGLVVVVCLNIV